MVKVLLSTLKISRPKLYLSFFLAVLLTVLVHRALGFWGHVKFMGGENGHMYMGILVHPPFSQKITAFIAVLCTGVRSRICGLLL